MIGKRVLFRYALSVLAAIGLGFASRAFSEQLPLFVTRHFGDALWACMVYFGIRTIWPKLSLAGSAGFALIFCFGIEFSQLYQADWINALRDTSIGALALGRGFLPIDLVRYSAGVALSVLLDWRWLVPAVRERSRE